jgi:hypothetical protein
MTVNILSTTAKAKVVEVLGHFVNTPFYRLLQLMLRAAKPSY